MLGGKRLEGRRGLIDRRGLIVGFGVVWAMMRVVELGILFHLRKRLLFLWFCKLSGKTARRGLRRAWRRCRAGRGLCGEAGRR